MLIFYSCGGKLLQIETNLLHGTFEYSPVIEVNVAPKEFALNQNYPNPFNPITIISWQLAISSYVTLKIYDVLGQEIVTLINENLEAGFYNFEFNASGLNSGVYFYKIGAKGIDPAGGTRGNNFISTKKMMVIK